MRATRQKETGSIALARRRGFTLLEMLVAVAIVGVMGLTMYSSLRIAFNAQESAQWTVNPVRNADAAMKFLRQDLTMALPSGGKLVGEFVGSDEGDVEIASDGGDGLVFYTVSAVVDAMYEDGESDSPRVMGAVGPGGLVDDEVETSAVGVDVQKVEYALMNDEDSNVDDVFMLVRRVYGNLLTDVETVPVESVVCSDVIYFNLRYYDGTDWLDDWDSETQEGALPEAVEITLDVAREIELEGIGEDAEQVELHDLEEGDVYRAVRYVAMTCRGTPESEDDGGGAGGAGGAAGGAR
ncbi:MAG: type II secretion system protein GspJ [Planctomycetota bacterium]|jgi:prepilin-type N-terminal cleavage/methylation domain-containing protein